MTGSIKEDREVIWFNWDKQRRNGANIRVKVVKIARNGVTVELPMEGGGARKVRVARDALRPVKPPPAPLVRPPRPPASDLPPPPSQPPVPVRERPKDYMPPMPVGEMPKDRMIGESAGRIPTLLPKPWDPMIAVGDAEHVVHAVPSDNQALAVTSQQPAGSGEGASLM
jgi:hypothetical protein